ncbi:MAG: peptidoglycan DD-metalloendopeptidase family protein, partial [Spirochaetales bacterium]|nr:peptidoglycan DD-metalloendopeptidase family protein [Spirochaetales bacterium]
LESPGLNYFNARWYDSNLGRFITEDPIKNSYNWYAYCGNDPINYIDPLGLCQEKSSGEATLDDHLKEALRVRPVDGPVTSKHGIREINGKKEFHTGTDYGVPENTPVKASGAGTVVNVELNSETFGKTVTVDHGNGITTSYSHNNDILVKKGDKVKAGQHIANSGNTGRSSGPHSDFVVRTDGKPYPYHASKVPENTVDGEKYFQIQSGGK